MSLDAFRRDFLGGSDAPAIVGVDPFHSAGDVWAEKTGRLPLEPEGDGVGVRELGHAIEPVLIAAAARQLGVPVTQQLHFRHPDAPLAATVDGLALTAAVPVLVECKTSGLLGPLPEYARDGYGENGTDEVPDSVRVQVHHQLAVLDAQPDVPRIRVVLVPALLGGRGLRVYRLERDDDLLADLVALERDWWEEHVVRDVCPLAPPPSLRTLRVVPRAAADPPIPLEEEVVATWLKRKQELARVTTDEEMARRLLLACLGDAEDGACSLGRVSYRASERAGYTVQPTRARTLRWHPVKQRQSAA